MSNKQTFCPSCSTTYRISVAQLTISQGMVCCAKCSHTFNALSHLVDVQSDNVQMFNAVEKIEEFCKKIKEPLFIPLAAYGLLWQNK